MHCLNKTVDSFERIYTVGVKVVTIGPLWGHRRGMRRDFGCLIRGWGKFPFRVKNEIINRHHSSPVAYLSDTLCPKWRNLHRIDSDVHKNDLLRVWEVMIDLYVSPELLSKGCTRVLCTVRVCSMRSNNSPNVGRLRGERSVVCWRALRPTRDSVWMTTAVSRRERRRMTKRRNWRCWLVRDARICIHPVHVGAGRACGEKKDDLSL